MPKARKAAGKIQDLLLDFSDVPDHVGLSEKYAPIFIAMIYCTPRYMDLEAGTECQGSLCAR